MTADVAPFQPPNLPDKEKDNVADSSTFLSPVPKSLAGSSEPCVLGVDEAGRGPVLGPMVYALSYCATSYKDTLKEVGFMDSKVLTHETRSKLLERLCSEQELVDNVGWATTIMTARDICRGMLRPEAHGIYNLNEQAHDTTMELIQRVLDLNVNITEVYVDTVGPPDKYQDKLSRRFPNIRVTVAKKADSIYPIVSAASICAKVTRDASLIANDESGGTWGSGYPSDSKTSTWLKTHVDPVFGWGNMVRFSWQTTRDALEKHNGVDVEWADDIARKSSKISQYFSENVSSSPSSTGSKIKSKTLISTSWYGANVESIL